MTLTNSYANSLEKLGSYLFTWILTLVWSANVGLRLKLRIK